MENQSPRFSVSDFVAVANQTLEYAFQTVEIEGEVASFKVNQGKFVFFDLKDSESSIGCFMMVFALRVPLEDGMKVIIRATPKLTKWGKFSLTVQHVRLSGEGSLKKGFELLKATLQKEGLFAEERKRPLPRIPEYITVISSTQAAGYADFMKILDDRWGGMRIDVAHVQVQGEVAADQMIRALTHINEQEVLPDVIVIIRGGGSADDLASFNDEQLVRTVAASRVPILTGIGHETDESLVDLAADARAATPSNAAELLVPNKQDVLSSVSSSLRHIVSSMSTTIDHADRERQTILTRAMEQLEAALERVQVQHTNVQAVLMAYNPRRALERGYSILRGATTKGSTIEVETAHEYINAEVKNVRSK